jgi:hypothetical protein
MDIKPPIMIATLILCLAGCALYLFVLSRITRVGQKKQFDREYAWLAKNIAKMPQEKADMAIIDFSHRWNGNVNDFTLSFHVSRLASLSLAKRASR